MPDTATIANEHTLPDQGPYTLVRKIEHKLTRDGKEYLIVLYGAYNALGLIGSEHNGIAILNNTDKKVVLDEHARADSGFYGPSELQGREVDRLMAMKDAEFTAFCKHHPRYRRDSL